MRGRIPFRPYPYQASFLMDRSPRRLVVKARQIGFSQAIALESVHEAIYRPDSTVLLVSRNGDLAANLLGYCYAAIGGLDDIPTLTKANESEMAFANGSRIKSLPANRSTGRGFAGRSVYLDEYAYQEYAADIYRSVSPILGHGGRLTVCSTPDGRANHFYQLFAGIDGGQWSRHVVPWRECPVYTQDWYERERPNYTGQQWASEYECLTVGTEIDTLDGMSVIEEVHEGQSVLGASGRWVKVIGVKKRQVEENICRVEFPLGQPIRATKEHPFLTRRGWVNAADLTSQDHLYRPQFRESAEVGIFDLAQYVDPDVVAVSLDGQRVCVPNATAKWHRRYLSPDEDLGRLFGYWLAEGSIGAQRRAVDFSFGQADHARGYVADCADLIRRLFGIEPAIEYPTATTVRMRLHSVLVSGLFSRLFGTGAGNKRIPGGWIGADWPFVRGLALGLTRGDGGSHQVGGGLPHLEFVSISPNLAQSVGLILSRAGWPANVRQTRPEGTMVSPTNGKTYRQRPAWSAELYGPASWDEALAAPAAPRQIPRGRAQADEFGWWIKIRSVDLEAYIGPVYNLDTDGDDTFVAHGVAMHNCDFVASGQAVFNAADVEACATGWKGLRSRQQGHTYVTAWDIGRRQDATVGITLDTTDGDFQVVAFERLLGVPFPTQQRAIDARARAYGGETYVESNNQGDPVIENLTVPVYAWTTTPRTKEQAITSLVLAHERQRFKHGVPQLKLECLLYQWDDRRLIQDCVITAAIAVHCAEHQAPAEDYLIYDDRVQISPF